MAKTGQSTGKKRGMDRISMILLLIYIVVLFISALIIGKLIYIQKSWEPDKSIAKYFLPPAENTRSPLTVEQSSDAAVRFSPCQLLCTSLGWTARFARNISKIR